MNQRKQIREALARMDMPQVPQKELPKVYEQLTEMGVQCECGVVECGKLAPVQDGINREKVENMKQAIADGEDLGHIVISKEGCIVDGHHRWVAMKEACGDEKKINAVKINLKNEEARTVLAAMTNENQLRESRGNVPKTVFITYTFDENDKVEVLDVFGDERSAKIAARAAPGQLYVKLNALFPR